MHLITAWANTISANLVLKIVTGALVLVSIVLGVTCGKLALREAVVIERGCETRAGAFGDQTPDKNEISRFLEIVIRQRFEKEFDLDQNYYVPDFSQAKASELVELDSRGIRQRILVNGITVTESSAAVDADRMLKFEKVSSAFSFPLEVKFVAVERSVVNPYGLRIVSIEPMLAEKKGISHE
jgi:hypothetical protein